MCGKRELVFFGDYVVEYFCVYVISKYCKDLILIVYNVKSFDLYFVLEVFIDWYFIWLSKIIYNGFKIMYMYIV